MTAARKLDPDDEALIEALAERIAAKLRERKPRPAKAPLRQPTAAEVERMDRFLRRRGKR